MSCNQHPGIAKGSLEDLWGLVDLTWSNLGKLGRLTKAKSSSYYTRASCSTVYCNRSCLCVCVFVCEWVCYHDNSKLRASTSLSEHFLHCALGLEPVGLMIKKSRLGWFGHVERKDDNYWIKRCITWEVEGIRQRGCPKRPDGIVLRIAWKI